MAFVYFILYTDDSIKIGCTIDIKQRLTNLMRDVGDVTSAPSRVLGYIEVPDEDKFLEEGKMFTKFLGMRHHKWEYFKQDPKILNFIETECEKDCDEFNDYILKRNKTRRRSRKMPCERLYPIVVSFTLEHIEFLSSLPRGTVRKFLRDLLDASPEFQEWKRKNIIDL